MNVENEFIDRAIDTLERLRVRGLKQVADTEELLEALRCLRDKGFDRTDVDAVRRAMRKLIAEKEK